MRKDFNKTTRGLFWVALALPWVLFTLLLASFKDPGGPSFGLIGLWIMGPMVAISLSAAVVVLAYLFAHVRRPADVLAFTIIISPVFIWPAVTGDGTWIPFINSFHPIPLLISAAIALVFRFFKRRVQSTPVEMDGATFALLLVVLGASAVAFVAPSYVRSWKHDAARQRTEMLSSDIPLSALAPFLRDSDPGVRFKAVRVLGQKGVDAVPVLLETLGDDDEQVRLQGALALAKFGARQDTLPAIPILLTAAERATYDRSPEKFIRPIAGYGPLAAPYEMRIIPFLWADKRSGWQRMTGIWWADMYNEAAALEVLMAIGSPSAVDAVEDYVSIRLPKLVEYVQKYPADTLQSLESITRVFVVLGPRASSAVPALEESIRVPTANGADPAEKEMWIRRALAAIEGSGAITGAAPKTHDANVLSPSAFEETPVLPGERSRGVNTLGGDEVRLAKQACKGPQAETRVVRPEVAGLHGEHYDTLCELFQTPQIIEEYERGFVYLQSQVIAEIENYDYLKPRHRVAVDARMRSLVGMQVTVTLPSRDNFIRSYISGMRTGAFTDDRMYPTRVMPKRSSLGPVPVIIYDDRGSVTDEQSAANTGIESTGTSAVATRDPEILVREGSITNRSSRPSATIQRVLPPGVSLTAPQSNALGLQIVGQAPNIKARAEASRLAYKAEQREMQQQRRQYMGWELRDPASYEREDSIQAITASDFDARRPEIFTGLKDKDKDVRWTAVKKLGELGRKDDLAHLLPLIDDNFRNIQTSVIDAIVKFQAKEHSSLIAQKLSTAVQTDALGLLEAIRKLDVVEKHVDEITPLIDQKNADVRCRTILLLSYSDQPYGAERISCRISDDSACTVPSKPASTNYVASTVQDVARNALQKWNVQPECSRTTKTDRSAQIVVFDQKTGKHVTKHLINGKLQ